MWQTLNFIVVTKMTYNISTHWKISTNHYCWEYYSHPTVYCIITYCVMHRRPLEINTHTKNIPFFMILWCLFCTLKFGPLIQWETNCPFTHLDFCHSEMLFFLLTLCHLLNVKSVVWQRCVCVRVLYFHTLAGIKLCVTTWSVLWFFYHITSHDITLINTNPRSWNHWVSVHDFWQRKKKRNCSKLFFSCFF